MLAPLVSRGVEDNEASVHAGFLIAYNSVRSVVLHTVREQLEAFPGYVVVLTGELLYPHPLIFNFEFVNRTLIGRRTCVSCCPLRQVEYPVGSRPTVYLWYACLRRRKLYLRKLTYAFFSRAGQPRTGDAAFADLLESIVGRDNIFRGKARLDCPTFPPRASDIRSDLKKKPSIRGVCIFSVWRS